jgi:Holliday junction resolvase RusA-like endonuclease
MIFTIYGELYSSKNSRQIFLNKYTGRRYIAKSTVAKTDEIELCNKLLNIKQSFKTAARLKIKPLHIKFKIYRRTRCRFDYINIIQNLCDCMVKTGLLEDDNANELLPVFEPYSVDPLKPRVEMEIL